MLTDVSDPFTSYEASARNLIEHAESITSGDVYEHLHAFLKPASGDVLVDIGAGTGRDSAWFADLGYAVIAVEPTVSLLEYGARRYPDRDIEWIQDRLPALAHLRSQNQTINILNVNAVWHHLDTPERIVAMRHFWNLCAPQGYVIMALHHGPRPDIGPYWPSMDDETITMARRNGFELCFNARRGSVFRENRRKGVTWTWLVFQKP